MSPTDPTSRSALQPDIPPPTPNASEGDTASLAPPQGWINDPERLHLDEYWQGRDEDLKESLETDFGVPDAQPLLTRDPKFGDVMFLFQSRRREDPETKYYVWNDIECELCLIKSPTRLKEIYENISEKDGYLGGLELEVVDAGANEEEH